MIIAVDGPAASGKGTLAEGLARHYSLPHLDTGLLYRAVGWAVREVPEGPDFEARAIAVAQSLDAAHLANLDDLTSAEGGVLASRVAVIGQVRQALLDYQRNFAARPGGAVLDGRDIGTVICPRADVKLFIACDSKVRMERRARQLEKRGMMIARVATGGGKSRIARLATARLNRPTLFLTTRQALLYQMQEGYEESGMKCGVVGDGRWEPDPMINVGMIQTIASRLEEPAGSDESSAAIRQRRIRQQTLDWLANFEFVIGEEAHEASGDSYFTVLNACKNARYRLALTATPFMKSDSEANMRLHAAFGPIGIQISEKLLIDRGILAKPIFKYVDIGAPSKLRAGSNYHRAVELGIVDNDERNEHAVKEALHASEYGLPVLVLIQRKQHGKKIEEMMKAAGLKAEFIFGESSKKKRDAAMERVKNGETQVLIGSTILDVGVDCPVMGMLILLGGGKAEVSLRQRIGRVLREKKLFPNYAFIVDFKDRNNKHILSHAVQRRHVVENTPGFAENILPAGQDFDFEGLGFERLTLTV